MATHLGTPTSEKPSDTTNTVTTTPAPEPNKEVQLILPTIAPSSETDQPKIKMDFKGLLSRNETEFKTNFFDLNNILTQLQRKQSCGCETYLRNLGEIRRRAISVITRKSLCVLKSIFYMSEKPEKKRQLFEEVLNELHSAKKAITAYIKAQEQISYGLISMLNNNPWVSKMTDIVTNAIRQQTLAAKYLCTISKTVPEDVNLRYGHFESEMRRIEETVQTKTKNKFT